MKFNGDDCASEYVKNAGQCKLGVCDGILPTSTYLRESAPANHDFLFVSLISQICVFPFSLSQA